MNKKDIPASIENVESCLCPSYLIHGCSTYAASRLPGQSFCIVGKSPKKVIQNGCKCPECNVFKKYGLTETYECAH